MPETIDKKQYAEFVKVADDISWDHRFDNLLDESRPPYYTWFNGGQLNTCYNAVDRHVEEGNGDRIALIFDSAMNGKKRQFSYSDLKNEISQVAGMLADQNVKKGDRVIIYMPMIPETVFAMLACARIGAIHSVVFGGFAADELAKRIDDAEPKLILSASCGMEPGRTIRYKPLLDTALEKAQHKPPSCIIFQREELIADLVEGRDIDWSVLLGKVEPVGCISVAATDPLQLY